MTHGVPSPCRPPLRTPPHHGDDSLPGVEVVLECRVVQDWSPPTDHNDLLLAPFLFRPYPSRPPQVAGLPLDPVLLVPLPAPVPRRCLGRETDEDECVNGIAGGRGGGGRLFGRKGVPSEVSAGAATTASPPQRVGPEGAQRDSRAVGDPRASCRKELSVWPDPSTVGGLIL